MSLTSHDSKRPCKWSISSVTPGSKATMWVNCGLPPRCPSTSRPREASSPSFTSFGLNSLMVRPKLARNAPGPEVGKARRQIALDLLFTLSLPAPPQSHSSFWIAILLSFCSSAESTREDHTCALQISQQSFWLGFKNASKRREGHSPL